jgi:hypothetical protein
MRQVLITQIFWITSCSQATFASNSNFGQNAGSGNKRKKLKFLGLNWLSSINRK